MTLLAFRNSRAAGATALLTLVSFVGAWIPPRPARAADSDSVAPVTAGDGPSGQAAMPETGNAETALGTVDLSTGTAQAHYPFVLPPARGDAQPSLQLTYGSDAGAGFAGVGWTLKLPSIVRKGQAGIPRFKDSIFDSTYPTDLTTDDYYVDGELLVPVKAVTKAPGRLSSLSLGPGATWALFQRDVDDGNRYFFNRSSWVVQTKSGHLLEFGTPLELQAGSKQPLALSSIETADTASITTQLGSGADSSIYRWNLVRDSDAIGNTVYYVWDDEHHLFSSQSNAAAGSIQYLTDVFDTSSAPPNTDPTAQSPAPLSFAHHTHLSWRLTGYPKGDTPAPSELPDYAYSPVWKALPYAQLHSVDVMSASLSNTARQLVRSYQLGYTFNATQTRSYLTSIQPLGNCDAAGGPVNESTGVGTGLGLVFGNDAESATFISNCVSAEAMPATAYSYYGVTGAVPAAPTIVSKTAAYTASAAPDFLVDLNGDAVADLVSGTNGFSGYECLSCAFDPALTVLSLGTFGVFELLGGNPVTCSSSSTNCFFSGAIQGPAQPSVTSATGAQYTTSTSNGLLTIQASDASWLYSIPGAWAPTGRPAFLQFWPPAITISQAFSNPSIFALALGQFDTSTTGKAVVNNLFVGNGSLYLSAPDSLRIQALNGFTRIGPTPPGMGPGEFTPQRALDVDGDGLPDATLLPVTSGSNTLYTTYFTSRDREGFVHPFSVGGPTQSGKSAPQATHCPSTNMDPTKWLFDSGTATYGSRDARAFADMDGDGVDDVVLYNKYDAHATGSSTALVVDYLPGRGDGRFGFPVVGLTDTSCSAGYGAFWDGFFAEPDGFSSDQRQQSEIQFGDLNADGMSDVAVLDSKGLHVCLRYGRSFNNVTFQCVTDSSFAGNNQNDPSKPHPSILIGDVNASGVNQVVYFPAPSSPFGAPQGAATAVAVAPHGGSTGTREGLLQTVTNALGATTTFTYDTVAHAGIGTLPVPRWVVTSSVTSNGIAFGATISNQAHQDQKTYSYGAPLYDGMDRAFYGFASATVTQANNSNTFAPESVTKTTFHTSVCDPTPNGSSLNNCSVGGAARDPAGPRALRGLPAIVEVSDNSTSAPLRRTTSVYQYALGNAATGVDGQRHVIAVQSDEQDEYVWGVSQTPSTATFTVGLNGGVSVTVPATGVHMKRTRAFDGNGNPTAIVDFGNTAAPDPMLMTQLTWALPGGANYAGTGDPNPWAFRVTKAVTGYTTDGVTFATSGQVREYDTTYDAAGRATKSYAPTLTGTLTLPGPSGGSRAAPQPILSAAVAAQTMTYDTQYGNLVQVGNALNACERTITYDGLFGTLPILQMVHVDGASGCNGSNVLTTSFTYDRGFAKVTGTMSPANEQTSFKLDDFGRVIEVDQPNAFLVGATTPVLKLVGGYLESAANHVEVVHFQTADGPESASGASYFVDHYRYTDALGEVRAKVDPAGPVSSSGPSQWILSGLHSTFRGGPGRMYQVYQPVLLSGTPPASALPSQVASPLGSRASASRHYDGLGRVTSVIDFRGGTTNYVYDSVGKIATGASAQLSGAAGLSVQVKDAEQSSATSSHAGAYSMSIKDGHGRVVRAGQHLGGGSGDLRGVGEIYTSYVYGDPTNPPTQVVQTNPKATVTRTAQYDSLGHMVSTTEPNSGTWTNAYDVNGNLLGTSDPRGCGENLFYDGANRLIAEDYSGCTSAQPTYTPANGLPSSAAGTEAFYRYDGLGRLVVVQDRAQQSAYGYDGRDRVVAMQKALAAPSGASTPYASNLYGRQFTFDAAGRLLTATTGADLASLAPGGTPPAETTTYTYDGQLYSLSSSYGALISSQKFDVAGTLNTTQFADAASTSAAFTYYFDNTLAGAHISRNAAGPWAVASGLKVSPLAPDNSTLEGDLANYAVTRDSVGNPTSTVDISTGAWPIGAAKEGTQTSVYYDDYRLAQMSYNIGAPGDLWTSPYDHEQQGGLTTYPLPARPSTFTRVQRQAFAYDWRGNATSTSDDANDFVDRSLGTATVGGTGFGPDQLASSTEGGGVLSLQYDPAGGGGVTQVSVKPSATIPATTTYTYSWDELGRLASAQRAESGTTRASKTFTYDSQGARVAEIDQLTNKYTFSVFGSLVLKQVPYTTATNAYDTSQVDANGFASEHEYIGGGLAHVFYDVSGTLPQLCPTSGSGACNALHMFINIPDRLGSTAFVVDSGTGEVVERITHQAYGALDADFRPTRWHSNREDIKLGGHWDESEVGLVDFGARHYAPQLGRFISPDPLTRHANAVTNPYEYANGSPTRFEDPTGLDGEDPDAPPTNDQLFAEWAANGVPVGSMDVGPLTDVGDPGRQASDAAGGVVADFEPGGALSDVTRGGNPLEDTWAALFGVLAAGAASAVNSVIESAQFVDSPAMALKGELPTWYMAPKPGPLHQNESATYSMVGIGMMFVPVAGEERIGATVLGELPWTTRSVSNAAKALDFGAKEVTVASRAEAEELFLGLYQGNGYRNATGMSPMDAKDFFGQKAGLYHWDEGAKAFPHDASHLQVHTFEGSIIRIFFP